jgi:4-hydroxy-tetrahydrodipicolinate reductase
MSNRLTLNMAEAAFMAIKVCLAGATGWAGSELARSIVNTPDLALVAAVSRKHAGRGLGEVLGEPRLTCPVYPR